MTRDEYRGCSRAWNDALAATSGDPVVLAADDLVFHHGWLDAALECLAEFEDGWGLVGFNDGHCGEELSTHYLMSRRFIVEVLGGVVAWEDYRHSFNDLRSQRARSAGEPLSLVRGRPCRATSIGYSASASMDATDQLALGNHPESRGDLPSPACRRLPK